MAFDPQMALRILCGVWFLPHAMLKVINAERAQATFADVGLRPGKLFLYATVITEVIASAMLIFDWHAPIGAVLAVIVLTGASYAVLRQNGWNWRWNRQGIEYMTFWSIACLLSVA